MKKEILDKCPEYLKNFLFYMETILNRSPKTVDAYYVDLKLYLTFLYCKNKGIPFGSENVDISSLPIDALKKATLNDIYEYLHFVSRDRGNNAKTRARKASSLRRFYNYLTVKAGLLQVDPTKELELPSQKKSLPKYLTLEESFSLLNGVNTPDKDRDFCILTLFLNCGMRLSELVGINLSDIRETSEGTTLRLLGKGNKERIVYLNIACQAAIKSYLEVRGKDKKVIKDKNALFLNRNGGRLTGRRVEQIIEQILKDNGLSGRGLSPHKLRHTAATMLYQHSGVDILVLKELLGHANVGTTEIYTHLSNKELKKAAYSSPFSAVRGKKI